MSNSSLSRRDALRASAGLFAVGASSSFTWAQSASATPAQDAVLSDQELHELVKLAFFWGMHPAGTYELRYVYTQLKTHPNYVGDGRIKWDRKPRSAADKSVSTPNATTLYGFGFADLRREPMVVDLPEVPDRYFSFQASDQYPRWFMQVGNQFTGRAAQRYLIVGPDFKGPYPQGFAAAQIYQSPSNCMIMAVRYALQSTEPAEIAAVNALQDKTTIVPLGVWEKNGRKALRAEDQPLVQPSYANFPRMADLVEIATKLTAIDLLQLVSLVLNDPTMTLRADSAKETATLAKLAKLDLAPGVKFDPGSLSDAQKKVAEAAFAEAKAESTKHVQSAFISRNGWLADNEMLQDINDYVRQGYYGLTTIGAPIPKRSHSGAFCFTDVQQQPLVGTAKYTMTFQLADMPPVTEFWELPIYDEGGYFIENEINRYSINSFMLDRGDLHTADGTLVIYIQNEKPTDPNQLKNWLPAPKGSFRFAFRFYGPKDKLIDWTYDMPGIVRTR
jgi:hypothetical protein